MATDDNAARYGAGPREPGLTDKTPPRVERCSSVGSL